VRRRCLALWSSVRHTASLTAVLHLALNDETPPSCLLLTPMQCPLLAQESLISKYCSDTYSGQDHRTWVCDNLAMTRNAPTWCGRDLLLRTTGLRLSGASGNFLLE
jgi:hypothetical protein